MEVIGAEGVAIGTAVDDCPHTPGDGELWQESFALCWFDRERGIGGVNRLGHEPNFAGGRSVIWNTLFTLDGQYYRVMKTVPLRDSDRRDNGIRTGDIAEYYFDGKQGHWKIQDVDAELDVVLEGFHEPVANIPLKQGDDNVFYSGSTTGHFECNGRVRGTARVGKRRYAINGLGHRNHSWGVRNWHDLRSHRWVAGIIDENFSFAVFSWHTATGHFAAHGHLIRDGKMIFAAKTDIVVITDIDSISHRGCVVHMTLPDGEVLRFDVKPICKGTMGQFHGTLVPLTGPALVTVGGRTGVCTFETSTNLLGGQTFPKSVINGIDGSGLVDVPNWQVDTFPMTDFLASAP